MQVVRLRFAQGLRVPQSSFTSISDTRRHTKTGFHTEASTSHYYGASSLPLFHKPGLDLSKMGMEVPENKRGVPTLKGIVIARRKFWSKFNLQIKQARGRNSPNIKELKIILEKKKVRRAKLYYLRGKMNALKKQTSR
ncbi:hypothetical protein IFM89_010404 [Coptis chinensis]|uniref:Uncharacterized protein n=1 Tax=Coptis chinensis TaxID=261450 RepID=A0A835H599_9MAGN|nr:hypothetical protein IFM89_010404 [Coptis chinensis]